MRGRFGWWMAITAVGLLAIATVAFDGPVARGPQTAAGSANLAPATSGVGMLETPTAQETPDGVETEPQPTPTPVAPSEQPLPSMIQASGSELVSSKRAPIVAVDPGHGGSEIGAVHYNYAGQADIIEKNTNLEIGLRLAALLEADGYGVVLTRGGDESANEPPIDRNGDGRINARDDLQARVDKANEAGADVFISIHNNGYPSPSQSGTEIWYDATRPFADKNLALAHLAHDQLVAHLAQAGYRTVARGIYEDSAWKVYNGRPFSLFVLGPARVDGWKQRATNMPAILGESLFVSNPTEAALLQQDRILQALAEGYRDAVVAFFEMFPVTQGGN